MRKVTVLPIVLIIFAVPLFAEKNGDEPVFPQTNSDAWNRFYIYANTADTDPYFPVIDENDLAELSETIREELLKADSDSNNHITADEFFSHAVGSSSIVRFLEELDDRTSGSHRNVYGSVLYYFTVVEEFLASLSETSTAFLICYEYMGIDFIASESIFNFINGSLKKFPPFIKRDFYSSFKGIFETSSSENDFRIKHTSLIYFIGSLYSDRILDRGSWETVREDIQKLSSILEIYSIDKSLELYRGIIDIYFLDYKKLYFRSKNQKFEDVSGDWHIFIAFLRSTLSPPPIEPEKIEKALIFLTEKKALYLELREYLSTYLNSFFLLQHETSLEFERIVGLFFTFAELYSENVLKAIAEVFANNSQFVRSNSDADLFTAVNLVFTETQSIFPESLRYLVGQLDTGGMSFDDMKHIYEELAEEDIQLLVTQDIALKDFKKILDKYREDIVFYLPLFVKIYIPQALKHHAIAVINDSIPFHSEFKIHEIGSMMTVWKDDFNRYFFSLLEFSLTYRDAFAPLSQERKNYLFRFIELIEEHLTPFDKIFGFTLEVYTEKTLAENTFGLMSNILDYLGKESRINSIFTSYYLRILKELFFAEMELSREETAHTVIDILKSNDYKQAELSDILMRNIDHLKDPVVLKHIQGLSVQRLYSPDIFFSLDECALLLDLKTLSILNTSFEEDLVDEEINREIFTYALKVINELFEVRKHFNKETLSIIFTTLSSLTKEKREIIISSLPKIAYLKSKIATPRDLEKQIPFLIAMGELESDLYEEFLFVLIPQFDSLIEKQEDIITLFEELDNANDYLMDTYAYFEERSIRSDYFCNIFPLYESWINSINSIDRVNKTITSPFEIWREEPEAYLKHLKDVLYRIATLLSAHTIEDNFKMIYELISLVDMQSSFLSSMNEGSDQFIQTIPLNTLKAYLQDVKDKAIAVEYGKKYYFKNLTRYDKNFLNEIINGSFHRETKIIPTIASVCQFDINSRTFLAGGGVGLDIPFHKNYLNYKDQTFYIDVYYLYDIINKEPELHTHLGILQPLITGGLSKKADNTLFLTLGAGVTWDLVDPEKIRKYFAFTVGLDDSIDFLNILKLQMKVYYFAGFYAGDLTTNRIVASLALSFKL